jgi:hypothetical protein
MERRIDPSLSSPLPAAVVGGTRAHRRQSRSLDCSCNTEKIHAVHVYLEAQFPDYVLHHLHAPTRLMQAGFPMPHAEHHVLRMTKDEVLPYYAVLLNDFQEHSVEVIEWCLRRWNFADMIRANRIAIASRDGVSAL